VALAKKAAQERRKASDQMMAYNLALDKQLQVLEQQASKQTKK